MDKFLFFEEYSGDEVSDAKNIICDECNRQFDAMEGIYNSEALKTQEDLVIALSISEASLDLQIPRKPICDSSDWKEGYCPNCKGENDNLMVETEKVNIYWNYCPTCGQRLDWRQ